MSSRQISLPDALASSVSYSEWNVCQLVAELLQSCEEVHGALDRIGNRPGDWVQAYASEHGWYRIDQLQRQLESWVAGMDEEPVLGLSLAAARLAHDRLAQRMAEAFTRVLRGARWQIAGVRPQTRVFADAVPLRPGNKVAYLLVDALRYEMGVELLRQLAPLGEHSCTPAIAALPTITKIGMAALLPDASTSFQLREDKGKLVASINETPLPDLPARQRQLKARVPQAVDLDLHEVLTLSKQRLAQRVGDAPLLVVRSQEIDALGELDAPLIARQMMDALIGNLARAVRKLAGVGVTHAIIVADHGHLFGRERGDDMKTESPGGQQVELHRRCWVGRGGSTPQGSVRVSGAELGYATDLDFIFPIGLGVFRAGGGLSYYHGGISLQELVVPVIELRLTRQATSEKADALVIIGPQPDVLRTRTLGVTLTLTGSQSTQPLTVRPVLLAGGEQVGFAGMAYGGAFDRETGCVTLAPGATVTVGMLLTRESSVSVRVVVQNPVTDAVLEQTNEIKVELGM